MPIIHLEKLLKSTTGGALEELVKQAEGMDRLLAGLKEAVGPGLASHLKGVNLRPDRQLVVIADTPAWASRLRFEAETLMAAARGGGAEVSSCKVIVARNSPDKPGQ